jgi:predicted Zn-dependent protease
MKKTTLCITTLILLLCACSTGRFRLDEQNLNLRTTFEESIGTTVMPELDENQKIWLAALSGIIMSSNKSNMDTLEVGPFNERTKENWLNVLSRDWGIKTRDDLLDTISHMEYSGHNDTFLSIKRLMDHYDNPLPNEIVKIEPLSNKKQNYYAFIYESSGEYDDINLIAWDLGRMTSLIRWGYQVGFLTETESWNMLLYFGNKIQLYYDSWEEYGEAYKSGRIFWASGFGKENLYREKTEVLVDELLNENGFWSNLKWHIKLPQTGIKLYSNSEISSLKKQAIETDKMYNVSAWKYKNVYIALGNHYLRNLSFDDASNYYERGLRLDSDNWDLQMRLAKVEYLQQKLTNASGRLEHIERNCNDKIILSMAAQMKKILPEVNEAVVPANYDKVLLIHTYGYIPEYILESLKSRISQEFRIRVLTGDEKLQLSETNYRSSQVMLDRYISRTVENYAENRTSEYNKIAKTLNLDDTGELSLENKYRFVEYLYNKSSDGRKIWPDLINRMNPQYNGDIARDDLIAAYANELAKPNVLGVLGVTMKDLYTGDYNYLFGWNGPEGAVMSIHRFYTEDTPLTNVIKRSVNQAFSSTGFILGIPRCTVANCPRSYPHNLEEHDNKEDILCYECKAALTQLYQK